MKVAHEVRVSCEGGEDEEDADDHPGRDGRHPLHVRGHGRHAVATVDQWLIQSMVIELPSLLLELVAS